MGVVRPWTQKEDDTLARLRSQGRTYRDIMATGLLPGRSYLAIANRLSGQKTNKVKNQPYARKRDSECSPGVTALANRIRREGPIPTHLLSLADLDIEREYDTLFERDGKRLTLTSYGYQMLEAQGVNCA